MNLASSAQSMSSARESMSALCNMLICRVIQLKSTTRALPKFQLSHAVIRFKSKRITCGATDLSSLSLSAAELSVTMMIIPIEGEFNSLLQLQISLALWLIFHDLYSKMKRLVISM